MSSPAATSSDGPKSASRAGFFERYFPTMRQMMGNLGWPILLKQLRTDFRRNRFFFTHFICLFVIAVVLIFLVATKSSESNVTAPQIGQSLFYSFFVVQFALVLLIFPLFSSTAFSDEKSKLTLDLLLITTLRPSEIVWGKFLAASGYCLIYILATIPLLAVSFLFGGVTVTDVLIAYAILIGLTLLVSMMSLWISSFLKANVWATVLVYFIILKTAVWTEIYVHIPVAKSLENSNETIISALLDHLGARGEGSWLLLLILSVDVIAIFSYFFLFATNSVRPAADDRSSKIRLLTLFYVPLRIVLSVIRNYEGVWFGKAPAPASGSLLVLDDEVQGTLLFSALLLFLVTLVFPTEDANLSRRIRTQFGKLRGILAPLRIVAPGPFTGFLYVCLVSGFVCGLLLVLLAPWVEAWGNEGLSDRLRESLFTLPLYFAALGALGFLLSACSFTPLYARLTVAFLVIITLLLPMILYFGKTQQPLLRILYAFSPLVLWNLMDQEPGLLDSDQVSPDLWGTPMVDIAKVLYLLVTVTCIGFGIWAARRAGYPVWRYGARASVKSKSVASENAARGRRAATLEQDAPS